MALGEIGCSRAELSSGNCSEIVQNIAELTGCDLSHSFSVNQLFPTLHNHLRLQMPSSDWFLIVVSPSPQHRKPNTVKLFMHHRLTRDCRDDSVGLEERTNRKSIAAKGTSESFRDYAALKCVLDVLETSSHRRLIHTDDDVDFIAVLWMFIDNSYMERQGSCLISLNTAHIVLIRGQGIECLMAPSCFNLFR